MSYKKKTAKYPIFQGFFGSQQECTGSVLVQTEITSCQHQLKVLRQFPGFQNLLPGQILIFLDNNVKFVCEEFKFTS